MPQIIMIAHYMSGDRNTIASALHLEPKNLCVCVYGPQNDPRTDELHQFFVSKFANGKKIRVGLFYVISRQETERINTVLKRPKADKDAFAQIVGWMAMCFEVDRKTVVLNIPSVATTIVGEHFGKKHQQTRARLLDLWSMPLLAEKFNIFLGELGFKLDGCYAFLWCKTGAMTSEKAHHYTDPDTWCRLIQGLSYTDWQPVLVGDDVGLQTRVSLVKFWKLWTRFFGEEMTREMQQAFWAHIAVTFGDRCCAIGMRSGMLEVPALLGIRTLYLEEAENAQQNRMAAWLLKMDSWYRAVLPVAPGLPQLGYQLRDMNASPRSFPKTVQSMGGDLGRVIGNLEKGVKVRIALVVYRALARQPQERKHHLKTIVERIFGFLDLDIRDERFALAELSVERIVLWVCDPGRCLSKLDKYDKIAEEAIKLGVVQIQGHAVQARSSSLGSSSSHSLMIMPSQAPSRRAPKLTIPMQSVLPSMGSILGTGGGSQQPGQMIPYSPPFESVARNEFDQLSRLIRTMDNTSRGYYLILERIYFLHTKYRFR